MIASDMSQRNAIVKLIRDDRTVQALLIALVLVFGMGMLRPEKQQGIAMSHFWSLKIQAQNCADMVLAGDSRTFCSLSPAAMNQVCPDYRIFNYAFGGNAYASLYCRRLESVLDENSTCPTIVLGITPNSLRTEATQRNGFLEYLGHSSQEKWIRYHFGHVHDFFEPMSFRDAWEGLFPQSRTFHEYREYHADGWVGANIEPPSVKRQLWRYRRRFEKSRVSCDLADALLSQVGQWVEKEIRVYAFRPPASGEMFELEDAISGFDEADFVKRFEAAGGQWLSAPRTDYASYDGSHLRQDEAVRFSREFASMLQSLITKAAQRN